MEILKEYLIRENTQSFENPKMLKNSKNTKLTDMMEVVGINFNLKVL